MYYEITLDRQHYKRHNEIYDWIVQNTEVEYFHGYSIRFGYQTINLTESEKDRFLKWLDRKRGVKVVER